MDVLKNKTYKSYSYKSRYSSLPIYYHSEDNKGVVGIGDQLEMVEETYTYPVQPGDTLDDIALSYYGRPDLYGIIADYNHIQDPFVELSKKYKNIVVPALTLVGGK